MNYGIFGHDLLPPLPHRVPLDWWHTLGGSGLEVGISHPSVYNQHFLYPPERVRGQATTISHFDQLKGWGSPSPFCPHLQNGVSTQAWQAQNTGASITLTPVSLLFLVLSYWVGLPVQNQLALVKTDFIPCSDLMGKAFRSLPISMMLGVQFLFLY